MTRIAIASTLPALDLDEDLPPLREALDRAGIGHETLVWDDVTVSWARFDAVLIRSTWDYTQRLPEFLDWCARVSAQTRLINPLEIVRWNTDKRYLGELAKKGLPVIESFYIAPGERSDGFPGWPEFVVKPTVGAGSRDTQRYIDSERGPAAQHVERLLNAGRHVLVQPYLAQVDSAGETALLFFGGKFSHAIRKGPLLKRGEGPTRALFAAEHITAREPSAQEMATARQVLAALPVQGLAYARVDLLPSVKGPQLLELELTEPSLFFHTSAEAADRFVATLREKLRERG
ncbi:MAG: RimK family alpha-L-glutamate ligase [Lysobacterales bacterium]